MLFMVLISVKYIIIIIVVFSYYFIFLKAGNSKSCETHFIRY